MITNRSVPPDILMPHISYQDLGKAIDWLGRVFGFEEQYRYGDPLRGAQMHLGHAWIMAMQAEEGKSSPKQLGYGTQSLTVFVEAIEAHFQRTKAAGVTLVEELHETVYGELQYAVRDLDGHLWLFSRHAHDVDPASWGAKIAQSVAFPPRIAPMLAVSDGTAAVDFYKAAFGAEVLWQLGAGADIVAGLAIGGSPFFLAHESPDFGTRGPAAIGCTTVRIELFVDDPVAVQRKAIAAGAKEHSPIEQHEHETSGPRPIRRMLQGAVVDPFGHMWLIGKFLE
ncbi:MAG TPA: VOC family protein [Terracidiphilus sp.]|nr:VOC family protein [Terracidiphilus sp.]